MFHTQLSPWCHIIVTLLLCQNVTAQTKVNIVHSDDNEQQLQSLMVILSYSRLLYINVKVDIFEVIVKKRVCFASHLFVNLGKFVYYYELVSMLVIVCMTERVWVRYVYLWEHIMDISDLNLFLKWNHSSDVTLTFAYKLINSLVLTNDLPESLPQEWTLTSHYHTAQVNFDPLVLQRNNSSSSSEKTTCLMFLISARWHFLLIWGPVDKRVKALQHLGKVSGHVDWNQVWNLNLFQHPFCFHEFSLCNRWHRTCSRRGCTRCFLRRHPQPALGPRLPTTGS